MEHRRFLADPEAHRPFVGSDLLARIGGPAAVGVFVDRTQVGLGGAALTVNRGLLDL